MAKTKSLSKIEVTEQRLATLDYGEDSEGGLERTADDIKIAFLLLLQSLSPQITGVDNKEIKGAEIGQFADSVTNELFGDEVIFVPAIRQRCFVEWKPERAGFVARHDPDTPMVKKALATQSFPNYKSPDGNDLVKTIYLWGIRVNNETSQTFPMIAAFDRTKIDVYKTWRTKIDMLVVGEAKAKPPMWAHLLRITSEQKVNKSNQPYQNFVLTPAIEGCIKQSLLRPDDPRFIEARNVRGLVTEGTIEADEKSREGGSESSSGDSPF